MSESSDDSPRADPEVSRRSMVGLPPSQAVRRVVDVVTTTEVKVPKKRGRKRKRPLEDVETSAASAPRPGHGDEGAGGDEVKRKRRKRRKIRFGTDNPMKAKRRAERRERLAAERKESHADASNRGMVEREGEDSAFLDENDHGVEEGGVDEMKSQKPKPSLYNYSPFQLLCDYLLRKLMAKDPEEFFAHPVDIEISPDYLDIVLEPMDFSTMLAKVEANTYQQLDEMRHDTELIATNALLYNQPGTIYNLAAQKFKSLAAYYFSRQYLSYLRYSLPFGRQILPVQMGLTEGRVSNTAASCRRPEAEGEIELLADPPDESDAGEIVNAAEKSVKSRIAGRPSLPELGYLDNKDGALALNILTGAERSRLMLSDHVKKLEKGTPGLCQPFEPRLCVDYPVVPLTQGPYSSFALQYDSTWATLSKRDSDLLSAHYGSRENAADAFALRQMVEGAGDFLTDVDDYMDELTGGEHRRIVAALDERGHPSGRKEKLSEILDNVKSLENIGLDLSFVEDLKTDLGLRAPGTNVPSFDTADKRLQRSGTMISDLVGLQYTRLKAPPPITLSDQANHQPNGVERDLAARVAGELSTSVRKLGAKPEQLVSAPTLHHALGLDDDDYDVLREFMMV